MKNKRWFRTVQEDSGEELRTFFWRVYFAGTPRCAVYYQEQQCVSLLEKYLYRRLSEAIQMSASGNTYVAALSKQAIVRFNNALVASTLGARTSYTTFASDICGHSCSYQNHRLERNKHRK